MNTPLIAGSVVVGVDGSPASDVAVTWAAAYADDHGRPLSLVHAAEVVVGITLDPAGQRAANRTGQAVLDAVAERVHDAHPHLPTEERIAAQDPRDLLLDLAADATLLVVGSRGRGGVASLLLGSVSVAMAAHSPCPVVVARPLPDAVPALDLSIVVGVAGTIDDEEALTLGFELAAAQYRPLVVVHAIGDTLMFPYPDMVGPDMVREATQDWDLLLSESLAGYAEKYPDVVVHRKLVETTAAHALVDLSSSAAAVVVGSRSTGPRARRRIASVSRAVVERAHCTVLVVRGASR